MPSSTSNNHDIKIQAIIDEYTTGHEPKVPGLVYCAFQKDGALLFQHFSGTRGLSTSQPMCEDTTFWLASFTKMLTSVSCMQLVEQGIIKLDDADELEHICPELRDVKALNPTEDGEFELVEKKRRITLRMLLNHTAGFGYGFEDPRLATYFRPVGLDDFSGEMDDVLMRPLVNQPGETFQYGTSLDWVGVVIERMTGLSLEEYFKQNITDVLEMHSVTFYPTEQTVQNLAHMHQRTADGRLFETDHLYQRPLRARTEEQRNNLFRAGGHGCFGKPSEFRRLISIFLNDGIDAKSGQRLLKKATVDEMFKDQIPTLPRLSNNPFQMAKPWLANSLPLMPMPDDHTEGWGLSFSLSHYPSESGRAPGSASWEGLANLYWFADRSNNLGGIIASQILPYGDRYVLECSDRVETEIYTRVLSSSKSASGTKITSNGYRL